MYCALKCSIEIVALNIEVAILKYSLSIMVRPMKAVDIPKQPSNFRRVMKKPTVKNPEIEEKYKNHATMPLKKSNGPKIRTERDFSSQPGSFKKGDNVSKKNSPSTAESREVIIAFF